MPKDSVEPTGATTKRETLNADICVIGAGSGGLSVAAAAAAFGQKVVLIERDFFDQILGFAEDKGHDADCAWEIFAGHSAGALDDAVLHCVQAVLNFVLLDP